MKAVWYERQGDAHEVLVVGEQPDPHPGPGEVRVRLTRSGVNPGDTKKRRGWIGGSMPFPLVIPHSDGAGVIDELGEGVDADRLGSRAWVWGAQSYRALGTAAGFVVVPQHLAMPLPDGVSDDVGACLGIPGITAHRAVFGDGPVAGQVLLVQGVGGAVSSLAAQLARLAGATVIGTVRSAASAEALDERVADHVVVTGGRATDYVVAEVRALAPHGVDRVVEVDVAGNVEVDVAVLRNLGVLAAYGTSDARPELPFWPMLFDNLTIRLLGSDDFPVEARAQATADLTRWAPRLHVPVAAVLPLERAADAHELVDHHPGGRVLLDTTR